MFSFLRPVIDRLASLVLAVRWREPVRALGAIVAVLTVVIDVLGAADVHNWAAVPPVLFAELARRYVFSPQSYSEDVTAAFEAGKALAHLEQANADAAKKEAPPEAA